MGERFLIYVEPLYIQADNITFPQLKQVIIADAKRVVMEDDLQSALDALLGDQAKEDATPPTTGPLRERQIEDIRQAIEALQQNLEQLELTLEELLGSISEGGQ